MGACDGTPADERFQADYLAYSQERGRDLLQVILSFLFNLGIQQGIRMERAKTEAAERRSLEYREMAEGYRKVLNERAAAHP